MTERIVAFIALFSIPFFIAGCPSVKPEPVKTTKAEPLKVEPQRTETLPRVLFHDKCADILSNFVDDKGMVDYKTLKRKKIELNRILDEFRNLDPKQYNCWPKEDKIAFWLNAYNIQLLNIIIEPTSIRHIQGIWDKHKFMVMDEEFTLAEIEKRFFREQFDEPRVFFAIYQASLSGPPLRNEPYRGDKLDSQLDDQSGKFLSSPLAFRIDREKKRESIFPHYLNQPGTAQILSVNMVPTKNSKASSPPSGPS
jgi:hypothetical protein